MGYENFLLEKREFLFEVLLSKENGLVSFDSKENTDIFAGFSKTQKPPGTKTKFGIKKILNSGSKRA